MLKKNLSLLSLAILSACGGGGGGSVVETSTGTFVNSPTKGIKYSSSPSGLSGTTDADGSYSYKAGDVVTFSLDLGSSSVTLGSTSSPSATTSVLSLTVPNGGDALAVAQILETLDKSSIDGKMDVGGISLSSGAVVTAIINALKTASVSSADIGAIATGVQTVMTASNSGSLKYGVAGVSQTEAFSNLSKNPANQSLVETKIQNISYDGITTVLDIQDKTAFTNWIIKEGNKTSFYSRFGLLASSGLSYEFRSPYDNSQDERPNGTYVLGNSNRNGTWTGNDGSSGVFSLKTGDSKSYSMTYTNPSNNETGAITAAYLLPMSLSDILSKSFIIYGGCSNGADNTVTINNSGIASASCDSDVNGSTWAAGPFTNTLKYTETNGSRHYIGLTRLDKKGGNGNLPSGAVGAFMNISKSNYSKQPTGVGFKVN